MYMYMYTHSMGGREGEREGGRGAKENEEEIPQ